MTYVSTYLRYIFLSNLAVLLGFYFISHYVHRYS
jgi:hypothetical protein